jgi:hypothetical protein
VNVVAFITTTFDFWICKDALEIFSFIINLNFGLGIRHVIIGLFETKRTIGVDLGQCKNCLLGIYYISNGEKFT